MRLREVIARAMLRVAMRAAAALPERTRFNLLTRAGESLVPRYRFKWPQMAWWDDASLSAFLTNFGELGGFNTDRRLMLHELVRLVHGVEGDTAECGVYHGAGSYVICAANEQSGGRTHHIFDSFEGLSEPGEKDGSHWSAGNMAVGIERVKQNLARFERVQYHKGWIPERFEDVAELKFAFVHVDVDLTDPTLDSMKFFYPRLSDGGVLVCDDYGFTTCPGATEAIDEFLANKPEKMLRLSGGGGFLIKGCVTGDAPLAWRASQVSARL